VPGAATAADDVPQTGTAPAAVPNNTRTNTIGTGTGGLY
jgi:hypothetical protein